MNKTKELIDSLVDDIMENVVERALLRGGHDGEEEKEIIRAKLTTLASAVREEEREAVHKNIVFLMNDLKECGMYDGKVSDEFRAGWKDGLQWLLTLMYPNTVISPHGEDTER